MSTAPVLLKEAMQTMRADPARAATLCRAALEADPLSLDAGLLLSEALRLSGDLAAARDIVAPIAASHPNLFGAQRQLGIILAGLGFPLPASVALRAASEITPLHPTIWRDLAMQLALAGDEKAAQVARARHADLPLAEPTLVSVATQLRTNNLAGGEAAVRAYLAEYPEDVAALNLLAEAQARDDRPDEAEGTLRRCIALAPTYRRARHGLTQLLLGLSRLDEALDNARQLVALDPQSSGPKRLLAAVYMAMSQYERALEIYQPLTKTDSRRAGVWLSYGHALKTLNRTEEGIQAYKRTTQLAPHLGEAYWSLANLKTYRFSDADMAQMRAQAARSDISAEDRVNLLYALGKAAEDKGEADAAFASYAEGAALHLSASNYQPGRMRPVVDRSLAVFTRAFFAEREGSGASAQDPIFIVGLPRAGSTLLEQILASHSMVEGTAELSDMHLVAQSLITPAEAREGRTFVDAVGALGADRLRDLGETYLRTTRIHRIADRPLFINKMPNDFMHVGLIHLTLPNAKIIDARRHPMACGWSCFKQHFARGQLFTYDLGEIGRYYADYVRLMAHYDAVLPGRVHRVIHEELVTDPEPHIRALLDYCGLSFEAQCLRPHENARAVKTASSEQVRQPISPKGLNSWRTFEPHLGPLKAALGPVLDAYPDAPG
jgi:tetratricopeptide (TPR) repeat protein